MTFYCFLCNDIIQGVLPLPQLCFFLGRKCKSVSTDKIKVGRRCVCSTAELNFTIRQGCLQNHKWVDQRVHTRLIPALPLGGHPTDTTYKGWGRPHSLTVRKLSRGISQDVDESIRVEKNTSASTHVRICCLQITLHNFNVRIWVNYFSISKIIKN